MPVRKPKGTDQREFAYLVYRRNFRGMPINLVADGPWLYFILDRRHSVAHAGLPVEPIVDSLEEFLDFAQEFKDFVDEIWANRSSSSNEKTQWVIRKESHASS